MTAPTIVAVGDISFGDSAVSASFGVDSMLRKRPELQVFEKVKTLLQGCDLVFGNLETVLNDDELDPSRLRSKHMRGRAVYADQLVNAGFNVLNVANNHILQHGRRAFEQTVDLLRSKGIIPIGLAGQDGAHCRAERVEVRGMEIVFLGYAFEKDKYYPGPPLYAQAGPDEIIAEIQRVKSKDNIVVCSFHWGCEFITYPTFEQITLARRSIDAGCDLILGHHPHVLNGFECYKGKYVFYSLGNFLFDQLWNDDCRRSMAVRLQLARDEVRLERTDAIQIRNDYRPEPAADERFDERLGRMCVEIQEALENGGARHAREAERKRARNRYLSWLYLLTHLHRYDPVILRQIAAEAVGRRVRPVESAAERAR